jgi:hypothetical protein
MSRLNGVANMSCVELNVRVGADTHIDITDSLSRISMNHLEKVRGNLMDRVRCNLDWLHDKLFVLQHDMAKLPRE